MTSVLAFESRKEQAKIFVLQLVKHPIQNEPEFKMFNFGIPSKSK